MQVLGPICTLHSTLEASERNLSLLPFLQVCWWSLAIRWNYFDYFPDRWILSVTMIFGATIAGQTKQGCHAGLAN